MAFAEAAFAGTPYQVTRPATPGMDFRYSFGSSARGNGVIGRLLAERNAGHSSSARNSSFPITFQFKTSPFPCISRAPSVCPTLSSVTLTLHAQKKPKLELEVSLVP